ncbi:membrane hypothetical protein [Nitrospira lenta]|uniref:Glycosyltransferase RgtA/B/C/D-like domain-containing protein n=2 Tax=Nitrospira lenta TaxID=1436998 RepID=A0A330L1Q5_9BACT|nr:membrane hypothetical protein [Nitrospira lenta]
MWAMWRGETSKERTVYVILGLLIVALWLPRMQGPIDFRWDGGVYYVLGTSLAEGKGYRLLNEPGEIQANQYPPLFPLIIAAHQLVLGTSDPLVVGRLLRFSSFLAFTAYIFAIYTLMRRHLSIPLAFWGTVVTLLSVYTYFLSDLCFPDMLYGFLTVGFLLVYDRDVRTSSSAWAGAVAIAAVALRTAGIALLVAWIGEGLVRRQWKTAFIRSLMAALPVLGWFSYVQSVETSAGYQHPAYAYQRADYMFYNVSYAKNVSLIDPFDPTLGYSTVGDRVGRFLSNVSVVPRYIGESVSASKRAWEVEREQISAQIGTDAGPPWIVNVPLYALGCLVVFGTAVMAANGQRLIPLCILFSVGLVCLTPWPEQFNRYLCPTVPLLALSLCTTVGWIVKRSQQYSRVRWGGVLRIVAGLVVVGICLQQVAATVAVYAKRHLEVRYHSRSGETIGYRLFFYMDSSRALDAGVDWLLAHVKSGDVIASSMPHWVYLRTGNKVVMPPFESDPLKAQQLLESVPVTYLILDEGLAIDSQRFTKGVVERFPERWKRVYSDDVTTETGVRHEGAFAIYERIHPEPAAVQSERDTMTHRTPQHILTAARPHEAR